MTGNRLRLMNFMKKFTGIVRFENDHFGDIIGYEDYVIGDSVISRVYYVEGLRHNLFFLRKFCDSDLEVAFRKHSCYIISKNGVDLLKGSRGSNLYTVSVKDMIKSSPICLLLKSSKNKSWLWHHRLNHLNFSTINDLARKDFVRGLPRLKFEKDHLCSACQLGKSKKYTHKPKSKNTIMEVLLFGALYYPTNDSEGLGKLKATTDIGIFVGYAPNRKVQDPKPILLTPRQISSGLVPDPVPTTPYVPPTNKDLDILFQPMFDEYLKPPNVERSAPPAPAIQVPVVSAGTPSSTTTDQDASSTSYSSPSFEVQPHISHQEPSSDESSSGDVSLAESTQLATDALWCLYNSVLSKVEPKNVKTTMDEACWFEAMQEEIHEFDRLQVWELVPKPDCVMISLSSGFTK
ncbi:integrase, catalytic region, zinc finger, CCHC-type containing protein [Tanacetum coccineum]